MDFPTQFVIIHPVIDLMVTIVIITGLYIQFIKGGKKVSLEESLSK